MTKTESSSRRRTPTLTTERIRSPPTWYDIIRMRQKIQTVICPLRRSCTDPFTSWLATRLDHAEHDIARQTEARHRVEPPLQTNRLTRNSPSNSFGSCDLSSCWRSTEMISNGSTDANREVLIEGVGEHRLPPSCADSGDWAPCGVGSSTRNGHIDPFSHLTPGQALVS
jgi:hypothetical protein